MHEMISCLATEIFIGVGTYSCEPLGAYLIPDSFSIERPGTVGCVIVDGERELAFRRVQARYVKAYNESKLEFYRNNVRLVEGEQK